jgi:hypothetical protein
MGNLEGLDRAQLDIDHRSERGKKHLFVLTDAAFCTSEISGYKNDSRHLHCPELSLHIPNPYRPGQMLGDHCSDCAFLFLVKTNVPEKHEKQGCIAQGAEQENKSAGGCGI